jgi:peptidoglycan/LPS O-acetylase OafA/YrhL
MTNKNSNSLRCRQCGMINWATDEHCRRCHQSLKRPESPDGSGVSPNRFYLYLIIYIAAVALPFFVGASNPSAGDDLAFFFVMAAFAILIISNLLLTIEMFRVSILWGFAGLFLSPISTLLFIANYWDRSKSKIFTNVAALAYIVIMVVGTGSMNKPKVVQNTTNPPPAPSTKSSDQMPGFKIQFSAAGEE